jgi:hypothetical protein
MNIKDITPRDDNGHLHGYCKVYHENGKTGREGVDVHAKEYGYHKFFYANSGNLIEKWSGYYLGGERINGDNKQGYCYTWNRKEVKQ